MSATVARIHPAAVEGEVLDGPQFVNLYRLLDLERSAMEQAQSLTMPAAFEIRAAYKSDEWRDDKQAEWGAYVADHGYQPGWSATSTETFIRWLQARAERDGHPFTSRADLLRLKDAGTMHSLVIERMKSNSPSPMGEAALPPTEQAWRPLRKLYTHGFIDELVDAVSRAAEIAAGEGRGITPGIVSAARKEIWDTAPRIRQWVEQPGQQENRSAHDRVVTTLNKIKKEANDLRKVLGNNSKAWDEFLAGLAAIK